jgi:hypothetical protein
VIGAGVVVLAALVLVVRSRFDETWGPGAHLLVSALAAGLVLAMAVLSPREGDTPRPYQSVLIVAGFVLAFAALLALAEVLGADSPLSESGTVVWVGALLTGLAAYFALDRNSAIGTLLAAVTAGIVVLAFVDWVFEPDSTATFRWILVLLTGAYVLSALSQRDRRRRHAVQLVNAAGLAVLALAYTFAATSLLLDLIPSLSRFDPGGERLDSVGWGWDLFMLACAFGLIAYAAVDRETGPAYLGVANLLAFVYIASPQGEDGASLIGWPLLLAIAAGAMLWVGLRPTDPAPPEPHGDAPEAPTTPLAPTAITEVKPPAEEDE